MSQDIVRGSSHAAQVLVQSLQSWPRTRLLSLSLSLSLSLTVELTVMALIHEAGLLAAAAVVCGK